MNGVSPVVDASQKLSQASNYSTSTPIIPDVNFPLPGSTGVSPEFNSLLLQIRNNGCSEAKVDLEPSKNFKVKVLHETPGFDQDEATSELASYSGFSAPPEEERVMNIAKFLKMNEQQQAVDSDSFTKSKVTS